MECNSYEWEFATSIEDERKTNEKTHYSSSNTNCIVVPIYHVIPDESVNFE